MIKIRSGLSRLKRRGKKNNYEIQEIRRRTHEVTFFRSKLTILTVIAPEAFRADTVYCPIDGVSLTRSTIQAWLCLTRVRMLYIEVKEQKFIIKWVEGRASDLRSGEQDHDEFR